MANWFGKKGRGFWLGIWSTNPNVGNIMGTLLCGLLNTTIGLDWSWTWIIISILIGVIGVINLFFLVEHPESVGITIKEESEEENIALLDQDELEERDDFVKMERRSENKNLMNSKNQVESNLENNLSNEKLEIYNPKSFWRVWLIPGVIQFSL